MKRYKRYCEPSDLVGLINERGALNYLVSKFKRITLLDGSPRYEFTWTEKFSRADCRGIDIIRTDRQTACKVLYQVKSSEHKAREFKVNYPDYQVMFPQDEGWVII